MLIWMNVSPFKKGVESYIAYKSTAAALRASVAGELGAFWTFALHWRHNDYDGVSNHQPHCCLLNRLFRRSSKKTSKLRVTGLCVGNSPGPVNSPHKGPVTRKMFPFDDVIMVSCLRVGARGDLHAGVLIHWFSFNWDGDLPLNSWWSMYWTSSIVPSLAMTWVRSHHFSRVGAFSSGLKNVP